MKQLPRTDDFSAVLRAAGPALDQPDIAETVAVAAATATQQRGMRRADAIEAVLRAKAHDGRMSEPVTSHDADVIWSVAALLHAVAGDGPRPEAVKAISGAVSERVLPPAIETALNGERGEQSERDAER